MKDNFRFILLNNVANSFEIANIREVGMHAFLYLSTVEEALPPRLGRQSNARDLATHHLEPSNHPATFKTGVPGNENASAFVKGLEGRGHDQTFQGASPVAQRFSRYDLSRKVSMGCQKPVWRNAIN